MTLATDEAQTDCHPLATDEAQTDCNPLGTDEAQQTFTDEKEPQRFRDVILRHDLQLFQVSVAMETAEGEGGRPENNWKQPEYAETNARRVHINRSLNSLTILDCITCSRPTVQFVSSG